MAQIRAEVRDPQGRPVADGTEILFHIEGGHLSRGGGERRTDVRVPTANGSAVVFASSTQVGRARIRVEALGTGSSNEVYVYFVEEGAAAEAEAQAVHVRGSWVGYAMDLGLIEARDNAVITFGGLRIEADDAAQVDPVRLTIKATGARAGVKVTSGEASLHGLDLYYDIGSGWGAIRWFGETQEERLFFDGYTLEEIEPPAELPEEAFQLDTADAQMWAIARSISVFPYEKLVLRHASVYADGERVMKLLKYWVVAMPGYTGTTHSQVFGVNSDGDIAVDFPFFYRVSEESTGSIKLQHAAVGGSVVARSKWSLALEEAYDKGDAEGTVTVSGLPREDWGIEWRDSRRLWGGREGHFNLYLPEHHSVFADASVYQWDEAYRLNLRAHFERPRWYDESYGASADWLTHSQPLGRWEASYRLGTAVGLRHYAGFDHGLVGEHEIYAALDFPRKHLDERTTLTPTISNLFAWDTGGYRRESIRGQLRLRRVISSSASMRLSYTPQFTSGDSSRGLEHLFGLHVRWYHGARWHSYLSGTYELPDDDAYLYWLLDYHPRRKWRIGLAASYYRFSEGSYDDFQITVARELAGREIGLRWSEERDTISLELGGYGGLTTF